MATITEDYVNFETAKLLKEKGFDERLLTFYITDETKKEGCFQLMAFTDDKIDNNHSDHCYLAPTHQMAMKWLREVHSVYYDVQLLLGDKAEEYGDLQLGVYRLKSSGAYEWKCWLYADTYRELYEKYVKYCLENLI